MAPSGQAGNRFFGLCAINPGTFQLTEIRENGMLIDAVRVAFDSAQTMYVGTTSGGLKIRSACTGQWTTLLAPP